MFKLSYLSQKLVVIPITLTFNLFKLPSMVMICGFLQDVNNPILKEILSCSPASRTACLFLYCLVSPLLEELVYRGFLLQSLCSQMKWRQAVVISSCVFSVAHFSGENSVQLILIGAVLGSAYCWTGSLAAPFTIHSVYNAMILLATIMSQTKQET